MSLSLSLYLSVYLSFRLSVYLSMYLIMRQLCILYIVVDEVLLTSLPSDSFSNAGGKNAYCI